MMAAARPNKTLGPKPPSGSAAISRPDVTQPCQALITIRPHNAQHVPSGLKCV